MKKYIALLAAVCSFLLLPLSVLASQNQSGTIGTTVPTEHTVTIEAEHAFALYTEGSKGQSAAYLVPRFSEPEFELSVEDGYSITRVLVNGQDVTTQVTDGILKLSSVNKDQTITIETQKNTEQPEKPEDPKETEQPEKPENPKDTEQPDKPQNPDPGNSGSDSTDSSDSANHTPKPDSAADNTSSSAENSSVKNSADTSDLNSGLPGALLAAAGVCLLFAGAGALKRRK